MRYSWKALILAPLGNFFAPQAVYISWIPTPD